MKNIIIILLILLISYYLYFYLNNSIIWKNEFINILNLWLFKVVVGIIPNYFFASILVSIEFINNTIFNYINKFRSFENKYALKLFIISFICGSPTTSIIIINSYYNKLISLKQASIIINCSSFVSFLFLSIVMSKEPFIIVSLSQVFATIVLYIIRSKNIDSFNYNKDSLNILETINIIINDLPLILLRILVTMIVVVIISLPFNDILILKHLFNYLEVTIGLTNIINNNYSFIINLILINSLLSFNGLAINLQVYNVIKKTRLKYVDFLINRIIHSVLSILFSLVIYLIINFIL